MAERIPVLVTIRFSDELLDSFRSVSDRVELLYYPARSADDIPDDVWTKAEVLYTGEVIPEPEQAPNLHWIHVHYAGVNHLMDLPMVHEPDVVLTTSSGIHATSMAEYTLMLMLAFGHRLLTALRYQQQSEWPEREQMDDFTPLELRDSTVGIVGYGSIGREIARMARTLGADVLAIKRNVREPADPHGYVVPGTGDPPGDLFHRLYPPEALCTMVRDCDFVVITTPLTESTRMMFGAEAFAAMKPTAFLINIGRGGVVDEDALMTALQEGQIAGAALDVFDAEPLPEDSPLWKQPNLIITPHVSGNSHNYAKKAAALFVENLGRYAARRELLNVVDLEQGY